MIKILYAGSVYNSIFETSSCAIGRDRSIEFLNVVTHQEFIAAVIEHSPDLILADFENLSWNENRIMHGDSNLKIPFVVLATQDSEDAAIAVFRSGATDYIPIRDIKKLPASVQKYITPCLPKSDDKYLENDRARQIAEERVKVKNAKLIQAHEMAKLGTWEVDIYNKIATWSEELLSMYGLPPGRKNISFEEWLEMIHPDDRERISLERIKAIYAKTDYSISHRIVRKDGAIRHIVSQLKSERDLDGRPVMLIGVAQDITDLHDIRQALRLSEKAFMESESRYRQIVELANEGICLINEQHRIIFTNTRLSNMLGYSATEFFNATLVSFLYERAKDEQITVEKKLNTVGSDVIEICLQAKNGDAVWVRVALSPLDGNLQEYTGSIALISDITATRYAVNKNRFKAHLLNNIGQAVVAIAKDGTITYWNSAAETLFTKKSSDVLGLKYVDIVETSRIKMVLEMHDYTKRGKIWSSTFDIQGGNLVSRTFQLTAQPMYDERKKYDGMMCISTDITDRRKLEKMLESSVRLAKLGNFEVDLLRNEVNWSQLAKEIHGVPSDFEVDIRSAMQSYKEGKSRTAIVTAFNDAITLGQNWDFEAELVTQDSSVVWVRSIGEVELYDGKAIRILGSVQDITAQKLLNEEILNAYKERDLILESIGDAFIAVDQNWKVKYWNINAEKILSRKRDEVIGMDLWECFPDYVGTKPYDNYHTAMQTQTSIEFDEFFYTFQKWLQVSVFPSPVGLSIYFKDITEKKLGELQMMELNENLTAYSKDLISINQELKQFSYIVSHNLRAPVANIMGLAEELADDSYDTETRSMFIDSLKTSAQNLDNVITDLNDVLQLKAGGIEKREIVDLSRVVDAVLQAIQNQILKEDAEVIVDFTAANEVMGVKSYLYSIIYNLIFNAVKYRRQGVRPLVKVQSELVLNGFELTISDNGIGIDLKRAENEIFGMYKRFHSHVEGKGIGLFMVKTQMEILGGSISLESTVGIGTTFKLFFPS